MSTPHSVSLFDARPFFEKALIYGVQHGILDQAKLNAINTDAPKGMVQIARYFGTEFLRPELEKAKDRMVNLVSLHLEYSSNADLHVAAEQLRDHSLLSRSKAGSDMLKALIAMPQNSHFGMHEQGGFGDQHIPLLAKWTLRPLNDYLAELSQRSQVAQVVDAAIWMASALGVDATDLEEAGKDAEAVIRTALLALACKRTEMPNWAMFEKIVLALRKKYAGSDAIPVPQNALPPPKNLPDEYRSAVELVRQSVLSDMPRILDTTLPARKLFDQTPAFLGRYFWLDDGLHDVDHFDRSISATWTKATSGHTDDGSLLTLFLCVATGSATKTVLTEKGAATLVRKIRKTGLSSALAVDFITTHAPQEHQADYLDLWQGFIDESLSTLRSDMDYALQDALALLRRECHIGP